jgi:hypothetical protein
VVYIHGYNNCITNIVRSPELACNCTASADVREGYDLIAQFEKASLDLAQSGDSAVTNRIFVAAEVAYDQANDSPGECIYSCAHISSIIPTNFMSSYNFIVFILLFLIEYYHRFCTAGRWKESGLFRAYIDELLTEHMAPIIGKYSANDVSRVRIFSHSGGYYVIGNMAIVGGIA